MAIRKQNRCPACGNVVDLARMVYSSASQAFVCPSCLRAGMRPQIVEPSVAMSSAATPPAPTPIEDDLLGSLVSMGGSTPPAPPPAPRGALPAGDDAIADFAVVAPPPISPAPAARSRPPRRPLPSWALPAGLLVVAAVLVTSLAIAFIARSRPAIDPRRAWEEANREKIIALKSQAEELTIAQKLPEAHAKYRELEKLIGGQQIADPRLFDLVDQARLDQSRVYRMIMHAMNPAAVDAGPVPSAVEAREDPAPAAATGAAPKPSAAPFPAVPPSTAAKPAASRAPDPAVAPASAPAAADQPATDAIAADAARPAAPTAPPHPRPRSYNPVTDAQVEQAIRRGVDFLISNFENGQLKGGGAESETERQGVAALAVYALLQSSLAIRDERLGVKGEFLTQCLEQLKQSDLPADATGRSPNTYARSLRANALATYNRPEDRAVLQADVTWLINAAVEGTYTYGDSFAAPAPRSAAPPAPPRGERSGDRAGNAAGGGQRSDGRRDTADERGGAGGDAVVHRLDLTALRPPPIILAHNGEIMMPPIPPLPPPPPYVPDKYRQTPIYQLPRPGYRGSLKPPTTDVPWDNSNSQYGVLGVWAGAEVGIEVPEQYWKDVQQHWQRAQHPSGQWSYTPSHEPSYSMTVGGIATLLIAYDYLEAPLLGGKIAGRKPYDDFLTAGLAFLEHGDNVMDVTQSSPDARLMVSYNLFGLERVGLASGLKYIGAHDWYAELAARILPQQRGDGSWAMLTEGAEEGKATIQPNAICDTAYALLFLSRGRHPIVMNKLRFDGFWTNRPRDVANLAAHATREMERPVNWQVVDINRTADDWADSPILYLASNAPPRLSPEETAKIRQFVDAGGLLFTHADTGSDTFTAWAAKFAKEIFPGQALENLSPQHPLYSLNYKIGNPRPRLQAVDNGVRLLMIHSPTDLSNAWQVRATESRKVPFQLGVNLYLYATGKERFRNRLDTRAVPEPPHAPAPQIDIAQVQYDGNWNPEPGAWLRFVKSFQNNTGTRLVVHPATPAQLDTSKHIMAVMTGTTGRTPAEEELAPMAKFIRDGGTLLVDSCGGAGAFANAIEPWLARLDPAAKLEPMRSDDVFLKASPNGAVDLGAERLRLFAIEKIGPNGTRLKTARIGKGRVIFTPLDYTSGLLGTNTWGVLGYLPEYSEALVTNVVMVTSGLAKN